jgi:chemotaxis protein MotA
MDKLTLLGVAIALLALLGGNFFDGGSLGALLNGPAAVIVVGGTLGAALLQTPKNHLLRALTLLRWLVHPPKPVFASTIDQLVHWATAARRQGVLSLEDLAEREVDPFVRKGLQLVIDGGNAQHIREVLETDLWVAEQRDFDAVHFYESMGGYAPTIGILGAVLGLIQVLHQLADPSQLGSGIAVAFVATIYGLALANLLLIPIANKLRLCVKEKSQYRELLIEGLMAIAEGQNPKLIEVRLSGYLR